MKQEAAESTTFTPMSQFKGISTSSLTNRNEHRRQIYESLVEVTIELQQGLKIAELVG